MVPDEGDCGDGSVRSAFVREGSGTAGASEWTPWIAIAGLMLFFAAIGLLVFGIVEGASHLLAVEPRSSS